MIYLLHTSSEPSNAHTASSRRKMRSVCEYASPPSSLQPFDNSSMGTTSGQSDAWTSLQSLAKFILPLVHPSRPFSMHVPAYWPSFRSAVPTLPCHAPELKPHLRKLSQFHHVTGNLLRISHPVWIGARRRQLVSVDV